MTNAPSIWPALLAFGAVLALIPAALWLLKRLQGAAHGGPRIVKLVGGLTLGPRERIAVVEAQGRWLMLGVTAQSVSLLATLDVPQTEAAGGTSGDGSADAPGATPAPASHPFSQVLARLKHNA
jgi:flagellar protein FliO/FliZ